MPRTYPCHDCTHPNLYATLGHRLCWFGQGQGRPVSMQNCTQSRHFYSWNWCALIGIRELAAHQLECVCENSNFMAERSEEACQVLLDKLKQGQVNLHRNLQHLRPNSDVSKKNWECVFVCPMVPSKSCIYTLSDPLCSLQAAAEEPRPLRVTHVRYKRGGGDSLCCTKHLPVRRARTEQLSPATPVS